MKHVRITTLQWAVGAFFVLIGMMMLAVLHRFATLPYAALQACLPSWGTAFLLVGCGLLAVAVLAPHKGLVVVAHWQDG